MLKHFLMNLLLTFLWVALTGQLNYANFIFGYLLGFFILWIIERRRIGSKKKYFNRVPKILEFILYFIYDSIRANVQVAYDVITPKFFMQPGIVEYPMDAESDAEIAILANLIALTPGTIVLEVDSNNKKMYIHVMYLKDKDKFIARMKNGLEKKLIEILR